MRAKQEFNQEYYDRFYRNPSTRATTRADAARCADFVAADLKHLDIPVKRIIDVGCGLGHMLNQLQIQYPTSRCDGVEYSEYLCGKYGWTQGSVLEVESKRPYDLVVCNDVVQYLDDADAACAIDRLAGLGRAAMFFSVLTSEDWDSVADRKRTDDRVYLRKANWYRRRLSRTFWSLGGGIYLRRDTGYALWTLDFT